MRFPITMTASLGLYMMSRRLRREPRFPLVLMLEPLHACNLTCTGCGRIREYEDTIREKLTVEECLASSDECGAPIVSVCGGEPMIYPEIGRLVRELLERRRHIYLCTNGMFTVKRLHEFTPSRRFFFNVHLDGLEATHDRCVEREGVFRMALEGIRAAKAAGFQVCTNTTVYRETDMAEIEALFEQLRPLDLDGHMLSPAYSYAAVKSDGLFMGRSAIHAKFRDIDRLSRKYKLLASPVYLDFLRGHREEMPCAAWGNPTRNTKGWKGPCYLITDGHYATFRELMEKTPWEKYGRGRDPRCENCMVHCGYEPAAALGYGKRPGDAYRMAVWQLTG